MPINPNLPIAKGTPFREILENFEYMLKALQSFAGRIWGNNASIRVDYRRTSYTATHALLISTCYLHGPSPCFFFSGSHQSTGAQLGGRSIPISADTSGHGAWGGAQKFGKGRNVLCKVVNLKVSNSTSWMCAFIILDEDDDTSRLYCNLLYEFKNVS